jgi:hypothetical protein
MMPEVAVQAFVSGSSSVEERCRWRHEKPDLIVVERMAAVEGCLEGCHYAGRHFQRVDSEGCRSTECRFEARHLAEARFEEQHLEERHCLFQSDDLRCVELEHCQQDYFVEDD